MYEKHVMWTRPRAYWFAVFSAERRAERAAKAARLALVVVPSSTYRRPDPVKTIRYSALPPVEIGPLAPVKQKRMTPEERAEYRDRCKPIWARLTAAQGNRCYLCDKPMASPTEDHVLPKARGGKNAGNRLMACSPCNNRKAARMPYACELMFLHHINSVVIKRVRPVEIGDKERRKREAFAEAMSDAKREREAREAAAHPPAAVPSPDPAPPSEPVP